MSSKEVTIVGYGSLLSEKSARTSFPNLKNFRSGVVKGYRRVFNKVGIVFIENGLANWETMEVSSCSTTQSDSDEILVTVFEIPKDEYPEFKLREHRFRFVEVNAFSLDGKATWPATMCTEYTDEEYRKERFNSDEEYYQEVGQFYDGKLWRDDILPCRVYLKHCLTAAKSVSQEFYDNFLNHTYLADQVTTIRQYLEKYPGRIEKNVESSFGRYSG